MNEKTAKEKLVKENLRKPDFKKSDETLHGEPSDTDFTEPFSALYKGGRSRKRDLAIFNIAKDESTLIVVGIKLIKLFPIRKR
jgi:hypothetical protein